MGMVVFGALLLDDLNLYLVFVLELVTRRKIC